MAVIVVVGFVEVAVAVALLWWWRRLRSLPATTRPGGRPGSAAGAGRARHRVRLPSEPLHVVLDLEARNPTAPAVKRLADEAAVAAFTSDSSVQEVIVTDRTGVVIGRLDRPSPTPLPASPAADSVRAEPRSRAHAPSVVTSARALSRPTISHDLDPADLHVEGRPLAQQFDLPTSVTQRLRSQDDPVELVRAILDAAGLAPRVSASTITCGDRAVIVIGADGSFGGHDALNRAYLRFQETGARSGLTVSFTNLDQADARRRELLAPALRHVTSTSIQRMADALVAGADPITFATGPVVL